jgi:murein hydrolase activator
MRRIQFLITIALFLFCHVPALMGQTKEELERERQQIQREIAELKKSQSQIASNKKQNLGQLALIQRQISKRNQVIGSINKQVRLIDGDIFQNNREIYRLNKELDTLRMQYAKTVEYAYKNRSNYDMLNFIFSAANFNDAIRRVTYLKSYRRYREQQVENINKTSDLLQQKINTLSQNKKEKSQVLVEQTKEMKELETDKKEKDKVLAQLKSKEKELSKQMAAKRKRERDIQNAITAILRRIAEDERKKAAAAAAARAKENANNSGNATKPVATTSKTSRPTSIYESTPESVELSENFESNRGKLPWPVEKGLVTAEYGRNKIEGTTLYEDNIGITIQTNVGTTVKAVFGGSVVSVYDVAGTQTVTIRHGKYLTTYNNLSGVSVSKGQNVTTGQVLGRAAENLDGDGEIIFVITNESKFMDPMGWLKRR